MKSILPFFSIVITTFNRELSVIRCIESCVKQSFKDFEILLVDDCSSDSTIDLVNSKNYNQLRIISHKKNMGNSAARHNGSLNAKGQWIINIDSDHAFEDGALDFFFNHAKSIEESVGLIGASFRFDNGRISPSFVPKDKIDYIGRIKWVEDEGGNDYVCCYRRALYDYVQWPSQNRVGDGIFQLNLAKITDAIIFPDVVAMQYTEDDNSQSRYTGLVGVKKIIFQANDRLWQENEIINIHGDMLNKYAKNTYKDLILKQALYYFLTNKKVSGLKSIIKFLGMNPYSIKAWAILLFGFNRYLLAFTQMIYRSK